MMSRSILFISNNLKTIFNDSVFKQCQYPIVIDEEKAIGIEKVRELQKLLSLRPVGGQINCAVILRAETLTLEAQNALLKLLEEPPEDTIIVLVTIDAELLLPTIVSRCEIIHDKQTDSKFEIRNSKQILNSNDQNIWKLAEELGKDRQKAIEWCLDLERYCHEKIQKRGDLSNMASLAKKARKARDLLSKNINVRLVIENIFC